MSAYLMTLRRQRRIAIDDDKAAPDRFPFDIAALRGGALPHRRAQLAQPRLQLAVEALLAVQRQRAWQGGDFVNRGLELATQGKMARVDVLEHSHSAATHLPLTLRSITNERDCASSPPWFCGENRK